MYQNTTDPAQILAMLAFESRRPTASVAEAIARKLQMIMGVIGVRSAFLSSIRSSEVQILAIEGEQGCGLPLGSLPLEESFCQYVKATDGPIVISDAASDIRVTQIAARRDFHIGAYLGVPVRLMNDQLYGTLCVVDSAAQSFTPSHVALMQIVAGDIASLLDLHLTTQSTAQALSEADHDLLSAFAALDGQRNILNMVAHDLRTPLMTINFSTEALSLGYFGPLRADQQELASLVLSAGLVMQRLLTDLSDAIDADSPTLSLITEPLDAHVIGQELIALCQPAAQAAGLELRLDIDEPSLPMVSDRTRLLQIMLNLLNNAIRYTPQGSVTLQVRAEQDMVRFAVIDTGPGISPENQERIWQPYERAAKERAGFGLGLYIVRRLAKAMGGHVGLASEPNQGSIFWVSLPRNAARPQLVGLNE
jgi:signal transduction histidine kinase